MMCKALGVVRASFYRWLKRKEAGPTQRDARHQELVAVIKAKVKATKGMAGRQALTVLLNVDGVKVSESTVGAIMRAHGLQAKRLRAFTTTTVQDPQANTAHIVNHMLDADGNRDFSSQAPGTRLCGDITYLRTGEGWLYLATVLDLCTGMVIGWSMADHMRSSLVIDAMEMARDHGYMCSDQVVYHTDRGAQYTSARFQAWCVGNGVTQSMGKVGVCWDNAVAENFFLASEDRVLPSRVLQHAAGGQDCGDGVHRGLVQPEAPQCAGGVLCPSSGVGAVSGRRPDLPGSIKFSIQLSQKLDERNGGDEQI
jgi:putative transposase